MAHELETSGGLATVVMRETAAWHGLGEVIPRDEVVSFEEFLRRGHLSEWDVRLVPLNTVTGYSSYSKDFYLVIRDNPFDKTRQDVLGVVGSRYTVYQNEQVLSFGANLAGWLPETAGSIYGGTKVFASFINPDPIVLDPNGVKDVVERYILCSSSHDGSSGLKALKTNVRVICANTHNVALAGATNVFSIRHTASIDGRVAQARKVLELAHKYDEIFEAEAQKMIQTQVTRDQFTKIVEALYPAPEKDATKNAVTRYTNLTDTIDEVYLSDTQNGIRTTAWGAYNALTERLDYFGQERKSNPDATLIAAAGFSDVRNAERQRIFETVKALTLV